MFRVLGVYNFGGVLNSNHRGTGRGKMAGDLRERVPRVPHGIPNCRWQNLWIILRMHIVPWYLQKIRICCILQTQTLYDKSWYQQLWSPINFKQLVQHMAALLSSVGQFVVRDVFLHCILLSTKTEYERTETEIKWSLRTTTLNSVSIMNFQTQCINMTSTLKWNAPAKMI